MRLIRIFLVGICLFPASLYAANTPAKSTTPESAKNAQIVLKLDQVLTNQTEILKQLGELKQELLIVKARATR